MTLVFLLGILLVTSIVIYFRPNLVLWAIITAVYFIGAKYCYGDDISMLTYYVSAILLAAIFIVFVVPALRLMLTRIIYNRAKKVLPRISETEELALNAGDTWFEKEIFQGKPNYKLLHKTRNFILNPEETNFLNNETNVLCSMIDDWHITNELHDLPEELWTYIRKTGFFGLVIPKEYGGKGFSASAHSEIVMKIATRSSSVAVTVMVPNSLGPGELLYHYGTPEQKTYYLPRLANGEEIPCFALTGPTAGSDATSIPDAGIVEMGDYQGRQVLGVRLKDVNKRYITLAPVATLVGLAIRLFDPTGLLNGIGREGITCVLLPHDHPGLEIGNRLYPLSQAFMNGTVRVKDSFIPIDWIIGGQAMAGEGWRMLVECLSIGRSISLPACGVANSLLSTVTTSAYAMIREQFNLPIGYFEGVEEVIAKMGGLTYMMNATRLFTVSAVDNGIKPSVASAIAKYHLTESGRTVLNHAMDVHAGRGIIMGKNNYLGAAYQGIPIGITVEGANIMTRNLMIFGQGAMRCHPFVRKEYEALASPDGLFAFDHALMGHIGYLAQNKVQAMFHAFTGGRFANGNAASKFNNYYKQITRLSSGFAYINDVALIILGGELKRKERLSARLGDVMSYLYMACATLKYYEDNDKREADDVFVKWVMNYCLFNAQSALVDVLDNFTVAAIGKTLKLFIFPYGKPYKKPNDKLEHHLAQSLLHDCVTRQVFKDECYIPETTKDIIGRVEVCYQMVLKSGEIRKKIQQAVRNKLLQKGPLTKQITAALANNIITQDECDLLATTQNMVFDVIQVDEFTKEEIAALSTIHAS